MSATFSLALNLLAAHGDGIASSRAGAGDMARDQERVQREHTLAQRIRVGEEDAFRALMDAYFVPVVKFIHGMIRDPDAAQDIAQDLFARIWQTRTEWIPAVSVRAYLYAAARNRAFDFLKHQKVREQYLHRQQAALSDTVTLPADTTAEHYVELAALRAAIARLPERRRTALTLRYELGMTHAEVGEALGVSAKAAKEVIVRTIDALRTALIQNGRR